MASHTLHVVQAFEKQEGGIVAVEPKACPSAGSARALAARLAHTHVSPPPFAPFAVVRNVRNGSEFSFADAQAAGSMKSFVAKDVGQMGNWQLKINDVATPLDQLWRVGRYTLG